MALPIRIAQILSRPNLPAAVDVVAVLVLASGLLRTEPRISVSTRWR